MSDAVKCCSCKSQEVRWSSYRTEDGVIMRLFACNRCKAALQRKCPQVTVLPVAWVRWEG